MEDRSLIVITLLASKLDTSIAGKTFKVTYVGMEDDGESATLSIPSNSFPETAAKLVQLLNDNYRDNLGFIIIVSVEHNNNKLHSDDTPLTRLTITIDTESRVLTYPDGRKKSPG